MKHLHRWGRILITAQIRQRPSDIPQERVGRIGTNKRQQRPDYTTIDDQIAQLRTIT